MRRPTVPRHPWRTGPRLDGSPGPAIPPSDPQSLPHTVGEKEMTERVDNRDGTVSRGRCVCCPDLSRRGLVGLSL